MSKYSDLSGRGGLAASGRWHSRPKAIVYCADDARTAYTEILRQVVHASLIPDDYKLLEISIPDHVKIDEVSLSDLDPRWSDRMTGWEICRPIGDRWFQSLASAVLKVPSAARAGASTYLINTVAADVDHIEIANVISQPFPAELLQ